MCLYMCRVPCVSWTSSLNSCTRINLHYSVHCAWSWQLSVGVVTGGGKCLVPALLSYELGGNKERGWPWADELLEVKELVKLLQTCGPLTASLTK